MPGVCASVPCGQLLAGGGILGGHDDAGRERKDAFSPDSLKTEISRLISKGVIDRDGANEHGPMYVLVRGKGGAAAATLN